MTRSVHAYGTGALILAMTMGVAAQNTATQNPSSGAQRPEAAASTMPSDARKFVEDMTIAGMAEVQLGQMASERGSDAAIKEFGQMMVKDHTAANKELAQIASQLQIQPPAQLDEKHKMVADRLSKLQGAEFDREYAAAMVEGHQEVASKLRMRTGNRTTSNQPAAGDRPVAGAAGAADSQNARSNPPVSGSGAASGAAGAVGTAGARPGEDALNQWASKALPTVEQHLQKARDLQQKTR